MSVWFIRHGESTSNAGDVAIDRGSTILTPLGEEQARAVSLKVPEPDLIVTTPYVRTHLTAYPLRARYPHVPHETWDLHEFSALSESNYVGKTWLERRPQMLAFWKKADPYHVDGEGAESFADMVNRIQSAFLRLQARPEKFIVVFAHGYIIQTARLLLSHPQLSLQELMKIIPYHMNHTPIENCGIIRLLRSSKGLDVHKEDVPKLESNYVFAGD